MTELFAGMVDALEEIARRENNPAALQKVLEIRKEYGLVESKEENNNN